MNDLISFKARETIYKIKCHACQFITKDVRKQQTCAKCQSSYVEVEKLARKLSPSNITHGSVNHQRRALWINAFGRIQSAPVKRELKTLSNDEILIQRTQVATVEDECSICMDTIKCGDQMTSLDHCVHKYHQKCIKTWVKMSKNTCPICNQKAFGT